jgi:serine/threonine-protein kinase
LVGGRYTVIERIGKGAMGVVYKCHDTVLDRVVAVKQMVAEIDDDLQLRKRFTQEARSAARLNHGNIITIYELHESDSHLAIVMELLEGVDLATLIKHQTPLPLEARLNLMAQVCDGLAYAHAAGIVHRDIKPANLHVSPAGVVKILDFGIARLASSKMTSTGGLIGTPDYMSPEQVMAREVDARSDLFAIGAVLYELVAGVKPFKADSITALLMKIVREPHVPLAERVADLPDGISTLVERLLAKDPADRPDSAREVREALLALSTERPLFDAGTVSTLAKAVTDETLRPRTPRPPSRASVRSMPVAPADASSSKLASLAIEQGRALRQSGDLAGAMKVFRSVLELAPGNAEALAELEQMERAFAELTASRSGAAAALQAAVAASASTPPGLTATPSAAPTDGTRASSTPTAAAESRSRTGLIAAAALVVLVLVAGGVYAILSGGDEVEQPPLAMPAVPDETRTLPAPDPSPAAPTAGGATVIAPSAPAATVSAPTTPARSAPVTTESSARSTPAPSLEAAASTPPPAPEAPPVAPAPVAASEPEPAPPVKPAAPAVILEATVRHYHGRSLRRGLSRGYCDGTLQVLADGLHFRTATTSDGRKDDRTITFAEIEDVEVEDDRIFLETEEQNWEFGATVDLLKKVEQHIKAKRKDEG